MVRVLIVDDHLAIREMMRGTVEALDGFQVAGQAGTPAEACELCRRLRPDLVILDLALGPVSGLTVIAGLYDAWPAAKVIVFSGILRLSSIKRALAAGAHGVIEKSAGLEEFHAALRAVAKGGTYFSKFASEEVRRIVHRRGPGRGGMVRLSERDRWVLRAVGEGLSSKEIAVQMGVSEPSVVTHRARLMKRTGVSGVAQLARYAVSLGLVSEEVDGAAEAI